MARLASTNFRRSPLRCFPTGLSGVAIGCRRLQKLNYQRRRRVSMTAVYAGTAGSGENYRIERICLDADRRTGSLSLTTVLRWWSRFRQ